MAISTQQVKDLRDQCGAGVMECRGALVAAEGDINKAMAILKEKGLLKAKKSENRATAQGLIEAYIHTGGRVGAIVEIKCETDFVARTDEFKQLAHDLAMQVTACPPQYISPEEIPPGAADVDPQTACLFAQPFIKDPAKTVKDRVVEVIAKTGENIRVTRFSRFELGS